MASPTYADQSLLARDAVHHAIMEDRVTLDPSFKGLPWLPIEGKMLKIPRVQYSPGISEFHRVAGAIPSGVDFSTGNYRADFTWTPPKEFNLKAIATDRVLDDRIVRELSEANLQEQYVIQLGTEAVLQRFSDLFINGNETLDPNQFDGLAVLVNGNTYAWTGSGVLYDLDLLMNLITAGDGIPTAFLMPIWAENLVLLAARGAGVVPMEARVHPVFGMRLHYRGIPILRNDFITVAPGSPPTTTIYAVQFGIGSGLAGIFPAKNGEMGVRVEKRHDDDKDVWYYKIKLECGLALYRQTAVASLTGVDVSATYPQV
jgi:hypothetical protein